MDATREAPNRPVSPGLHLVSTFHHFIVPIQCLLILETEEIPEKKLQRACCSLTMLDPSAGLHLLRRYSHLPPWPWASDVGAVHGQMDTTTEAVR